MDKTAIKNYAIWARVQLIESCKQRAFEYGITEDGDNQLNLKTIGSRILSDEEVEQRNQLISQINQKGYSQVMEEVAYTWFNRFIALRFMEVNGYLPSKVRVMSNATGTFKPEIIKEAISIELEGLDRNIVLGFIEKQDNEGLYKYLLITQCNALNRGLPYMFEKISNWTELLFPANVLRNESVIGQMVTSIPEEDWTDQVQIIGWLYQYYNSELKDETFALLKKNVKITKERIPAATQLFTPDWIVRYMVENSLGRLWYEGHPDFDKTQWKYYLDEAEQEAEVMEQLRKIRSKYANAKPEEIRIIDPCMGSGHILVYAFDVMMQIYTSEGWSERDAAKSIVENNLYGLDIDDRAGQLAYFAVMMKARKYNRRILNGEVKPNVLSIQESGWMTDDFIEYVAENDSSIRTDLMMLRKTFNDAKEYGSIINVPAIQYSALYERIAAVTQKNAENLFQSQYQTIINEKLLPLTKQYQILSQKYGVVATNPPYMGNKSMTGELQKYIKRHYPNSEGDLATVFMEASLNMCDTKGFAAMINIPVWMFSSSYSNLRKTLIKNASLINMLHLGRGVFGADFGTTAFVFSSYKCNGYKGTYKRLYIKQSFVDSVEEKEKLFFENNNVYRISDNAFSVMPNSTFAYWAGRPYRKAFENYKTLSFYADVKKGTTTGDDKQFLRLWFEVNNKKISLLNSDNRRLKWHPFNKGGEFRRWYGNNNYIVNWENDGYLIRNNRNEKGKLASRPQNIAFFYRPGITWTYISISTISFRYYSEGFAFAAAGPAVFPKDAQDEMYITGLLNSKVAQELVNFIGGTGVTYETGEVSNIPIQITPDPNLRTKIDIIVRKNIDISCEDWDSYEISWDYKKHPLI